MDRPMMPDGAGSSADGDPDRRDDADEEAVLDEEPGEPGGRAPAMYSDLVGLEADEADVLEQAQQVPEDEDDRNRG